MNFKPTIWKTIMSVIIGTIIGIYSSKVYFMKDGIQATPPEYIFGISSIIGFLISLIIVYLLWSLIQKKK